MALPEFFDSESILDQAFGEYLMKLEQHEQPDAESLAGRYPDVASQLRQCIATVQEVQRMAGPTVAEYSVATASIDTAKACSVMETTLAAERDQRTIQGEPQLKLGESFGRYRIERLLGQGAMGSVYLAYDEQLHRHVALKIPKFIGALADELKERFYREARAAATLRSANICPVYDVNEIAGVHYISMAYIEGGTLADVIRDHSMTDQWRIAELIRKLALALQKAHDRGIVHRDLKPGNVMLDADGEPIVTDFGLARRLDDNVRLTQSGALVGSPAYMSPEQIDGKPEAVGPASDIYSLGVILYELITGRLPFVGGIFSVIGQVSRDAPPRPSQIAAHVGADSPLETICLRMMAKRAEDRFVSMSAVAEALLPLTKPHCDSAVRQPKSLTPSEKPTRTSKFPLALKLALLIGFLLALAGLLVVVTDQGQIEIRSEVDDVRIVVEQNGSKIDVFDLKTGTEFHWLPTGKYQLLPEGTDNTIEVENGGFRMTRLGKVIVTVRRKIEQEGIRNQEVAEHPADSNTANIQTMVGLENFWMTRVLFSRDGHQAISTSIEGYVWDLKTGKLARKLPRHFSDIWALALSPDGTKLLTSNFNVVRLWDFESGELLKEFKGDELKIWTVAFSPDGNRFASAGEEPKIRVWDIATGEQMGEIATPDVTTRGLAFSSDGKYLASGHYTKGEPGTAKDVVRMWNAKTLELERNLTGGTWNISAITFSPDGKTLAASSFEPNASIRTWDVATGEPLQVFQGHAGSEYVVYSPDGRLLVSCAYEETERKMDSDRSIRVWNANTGTEICRFGGHDAGPLCVAVSPDSKYVLSSGKDAAVRLWRLPETVTPVGRTLTTFGKPAIRVAFSPDGTRVASTSATGKVLIHQVTTGQQLTELRGHQGRVNSVQFSADGKQLLTGAWDKTIRLWDVDRGEELKRYDGHTGLIQGAVWSPDKTRIASCTHEGNEGAIWIWDAETGEVLQKFADVKFQPFMVAYSPDGTHLLSGAHDGIVRLWDVATGEEVRRFRGHRDWVISVAFSSGGETALTASKDKTIRLWDVATGVEQSILNGHTDLVGIAVFSTDDRHILSGSLDETLRLWDATADEELRRFTGHTGEVIRVAISPDGTLAASAGADGTVRLWNLPLID